MRCKHCGFPLDKNLSIPNGYPGAPNLPRLGMRVGDIYIRDDKQRILQIVKLLSGRRAECLVLKGFMKGLRVIRSEKRITNMYNLSESSKITNILEQYE